MTEGPNELPLYPHLRALIQECKPGKSLPEIALEAGVPVNYIQRITRRKNFTGRHWSIGDLDKWAAILGCPVERVHHAVLFDLPGYIDDEYAQAIHRVLTGWERVPTARRARLLELVIAELDLALGELDSVMEFVEYLKET